MDGKAFDLQRNPQRGLLGKSLDHVFSLPIWAFSRAGRNKLIHWEIRQRANKDKISFADAIWLWIRFLCKNILTDLQLAVDATQVEMYPAVLTDMREFIRHQFEWYFTTENVRSSWGLSNYLTMHCHHPQNCLIV